MKKLLKTLLAVTIVGAMVLGVVVFASDVVDPNYRPNEPQIVKPLSDVVDP